MSEYFECRRGCTDCCSKPESTMIVPVNLGDAYRKFTYDNPDNIDFHDLCRNEFDIFLFRLPEGFFEALKGMGKETIFNPRPYTRPDEYDFWFQAKRPCDYLEESGCKVHGTPLQYTSCSVMPENMIMLDYYPEGDRLKFPCVRKGLSLHPGQVPRISELVKHYLIETIITHNFMSSIIKEGGDKESYSISNMKNPDGIIECFWSAFRESVVNTMSIWEPEISTTSSEISALCSNPE